MWLLNDLALAPGILLDIRLLLLHMGNLCHSRSGFLHLSSLADDLLCVCLDLRFGLRLQFLETFDLVLESILLFPLALVLSFLYFNDCLGSGASRCD